MGVWIVDGTRCTALRYAALHLHRNGRLWVEGVVWFEEEAQMDQGIREAADQSDPGQRRAEVWQPKVDDLWTSECACVRTSEQEETVR